VPLAITVSIAETDKGPVSVQGHRLEFYSVIIGVQGTAFCCQGNLEMFSLLLNDTVVIFQFKCAFRRLIEFASIVKGEQPFVPQATARTSLDVELE
jgi:hypothetical protein